MSYSKEGTKLWLLVDNIIIVKILQNHLLKIKIRAILSGMMLYNCICLAKLIKLCI